MRLDADSKPVVLRPALGQRSGWRPMLAVVARWRRTAVCDRELDSMRSSKDVGLGEGLESRFGLCPDSRLSFGGTRADGDSRCFTACGGIALGRHRRYELVDLDLANIKLPKRRCVAQNDPDRPHPILGHIYRWRTQTLTLLESDRQALVMNPYPVNETRGRAASSGGEPLAPRPLRAPAEMARQDASISEGIMDSCGQAGWWRFSQYELAPPDVAGHRHLTVLEGGDTSQGAHQ